MSALDAVAAFVKVIGSAIAGGEPVYNVRAIGGFGGFGDDSEAGGEQASRQIGYGALGVVGRPLPPEGSRFAEAAALRVDNGLSPIAWRDLRLFDAIEPEPGQLAFAGYGGAVLSHAMTPDEVGTKRANIATWYVPFDFDGAGVPQKAHAIAIDPTPANSSISLVHADGVFVTLTADTGAGPGVVVAVDDSTFLRMSPGEVTINAARILLKGNCYLGAAAEAGVPMLGGPMTPPSPSVFISPV